MKKQTPQTIVDVPPYLLLPLIPLRPIKSIRTVNIKKQNDNAILYIISTAVQYLIIILIENYINYFNN